TITPRAVITAVESSLVYLQQNQDVLLAAASASKEGQ
ncbi:MAG TPA: electron transporter RnfG, partial [Oceanospirillaceae bacterium]|nr:electron transporter RnfG [Oceanospirillaceae bacterium]